MAGDWIKMRQDLSEDPSVVLIASMTGCSEFEVVGMLHKLWSWADKHTTDGTAPAINKIWVDRYVSKSGFADAMVISGWISFSESGVSFPNFDKHNGKSAKTRAEASIRQRLSRKNRDEGVTGVTRTSIPKPFIRHVFERDEYVCVYCGTDSSPEKEASKFSILSIDHIVPESRGGIAAVSNLACCCKKCNNEKNDRTPEEWGLLPTFLAEGVTYKDGQMSQIKRDKSVTREEKRREEIKDKEIKSDEPKNPHQGDERFQNVWARWKRHLMERNKPLTPTTEESQLCSLFGYSSEEATAVVEFSILNGAANLILNGNHRGPPKRGTKSASVDMSNPDWIKEFTG